MFIHRALLLFLIFPFTQIIPLASYNQPYSFLLSALIIAAFPSTVGAAPLADRLALIWLAFLGTAMLLLEGMQQISFREINFWLSYISPLIITMAAYRVMHLNPNLVRKALTWGILAWVGLSVLQQLINPGLLGFLVSRDPALGADIAASGRGVLSFAPEPTHHGFHMLIMATTLAVLGGPRWVVVIAVLAAIVLARSSSALAALGMGFAVWALMHPVKRSWFFIGLVGMIGLAAVLPTLLGEEHRITRLILALQSSGKDIILEDYSVNIRVSGLVMPLVTAWESGLMPQGISLERWSEIRLDILHENPWVIDLSLAGPASGFGLILLQSGFLGLPVIVCFMHRFIRVFSGSIEGILTATVFFVFLSQLYLATPGFSLILAAIMYRISLGRTDVSEEQLQLVQPYQAPSEVPHDELSNGISLRS